MWERRGEEGGTSITKTPSGRNLDDNFMGKLNGMSNNVGSGNNFVSSLGIFRGVRDARL